MEEHFPFLGWIAIKKFLEVGVKILLDLGKGSFEKKKSSEFSEPWSGPHNYKE